MNRRTSGRALAASLCLSFVYLTGSAAAAAGLIARAGPYRLEVSTDPARIPTGPATVRVHVGNAGGSAVTDAEVQVLTQMPGMPMGERVETAAPDPGQPGTYTAPANFAMAGDWGINVQVDGPQGSGKATLSVKTGQRTAAPGGAVNPLPVLGTLAALGLVLFTLYRMRVTGQRLDPRPLLRWPVLAGVGLLIAVYSISVWAVRRYQAPGHMSVIEAQAMDMTAMKPPVGVVPVAAMAAKRETIDDTVSYTGSAAPFVDQDIYPRVSGWITWMPFYPGQHVRKGQLLAKLDASELRSKVNEQIAARAMAEHAQVIARMQAAQARATSRQAAAQVGEARDEVASARSERAAAQEEVAAAADERATAQADRESAEAAVADARAQLAGAQADQTYWSAQVQRSQTLAATGAISQQEYQQDRAQGENANAKVRQAQARIEQVKAAIRGADSRVGRADAMAAAARAKVAEMSAKLRGSQDKVAQARANAQAMAAAAEAAQHEIEHTGAGLQQAQAQVNTARVVAGYTEIRSLVKGVVTQRLIGPGVLVNPGQAILKVSQIEPIRLQANVAESDLATIRVGDRVRVHSARDPKRAVEARVSVVFPAVDPTARTGIVEALYPNRDGRFRPGEFLAMEITTSERRNALVAPSSAVVWQPKATGPVLATEETAAVWVIRSGRPEKTYYTCTMHPNVKQDKPGKCPT
jgi:RND family efflux transporter MFP subunit